MYMYIICIYIYTYAYILAAILAVQHSSKWQDLKGHSFVSEMLSQLMVGNWGPDWAVGNGFLVQFLMYQFWTWDGRWRQYGCKKQIDTLITLDSLWFIYHTEEGIDPPSIQSFLRSTSEFHDSREGHALQRLVDACFGRELRNVMEKKTAVVVGGVWQLNMNWKNWRFWYVLISFQHKPYNLGYSYFKPVGLIWPMAGRRGFKQLHTFDGEALGQSCSGRHSFKWHQHLSHWKFETRRKRW
jgi:hypothetical protein